MKETPERERIFRIDEIERTLEQMAKAIEARWDLIKPRAINLNEHRKRLQKIASKRRASKFSQIYGR